jgi:hypothetical protein
MVTLTELRLFKVLASATVTLTLNSTWGIMSEVVVILSLWYNTGVFATGATFLAVNEPVDVPVSAAKTIVEGIIASSRASIAIKYIDFFNVLSSYPCYSCFYLSGLRKYTITSSLLSPPHICQLLFVNYFSPSD